MQRFSRIALLAFALAAAPFEASAQDAAPTSPSPPTAPVDGAIDEAAPPADMPEAEVTPTTAAPTEPPAAEQAAPPEPTAPPEPAASNRVLVIDAAVYGISPIVGEHVSAEMRSTAASLGYDVLTRDDSVAAARAARMPYPPTPADLWRTTWGARAARGAFARAWAAQGRYVVEITVASSDGGGPFFARGVAGAQDLHQVVHALTLQALPPPNVATPPGSSNAMGFGAHVQEPEAPPIRAAAPPRPRTGRAMRWVIAFQTESAFGTSSDFYYNHLLGARLDYRISPDLRVGFYAGYANLRGSGGRANNVLMYAQIEDRVRITPTSPLRVPLRVGVGYLPFNGPVIRLAAGLAIPLSRRVDLVFDILAPTIWMVPDRTLVSLDLSAELSIKF